MGRNIDDLALAIRNAAGARPIVDMLAVAGEAG